MAIFIFVRHFHLVCLFSVFSWTRLIFPSRNDKETHSFVIVSRTSRSALFIGSLCGSCNSAIFIGLESLTNVVIEAKHCKGRFLRAKWLIVASLLKKFKVLKFHYLLDLYFPKLLTVSTTYIYRSF